MPCVFYVNGGLNTFNTLDCVDLNFETNYLTLESVKSSSFAHGPRHASPNSYSAQHKPCSPARSWVAQFFHEGHLFLFFGLEIQLPFSNSSITSLSPPSYAKTSGQLAALFDLNPVKIYHPLTATLGTRSFSTPTGPHPL